MKSLLLAGGFESWREAAREALLTGFRPEEIDFQDATAPAVPALTLELDEEPHGTPIDHPRVSKAFLEAARFAAAHRDSRRWNLLYRVLYRLQAEPDLLRMETDDDIIDLLQLEAQVKRDLHKMQAFVRFRKVLDPGNPAERPVVVDEPLLIGAEQHRLVLETPTPFGPVKSEIEQCLPPDVAGAPTLEECDSFIAWYQPEHRILLLAAPFFAERFDIMRWTILTPDASVSWDPAAKQLSAGPGVPRESAPSEEEQEAIWRSTMNSFAPIAMTDMGRL